MMTFGIKQTSHEKTKNKYQKKLNIMILNK